MNEGKEPMIHIRVAQPKDAARIAEIHVRTWQSAYRGQFPDTFLDQLKAEQREPQWTHTIEQSPPGGSVIVAVTNRGTDEQIIGFCSFGPARTGDDDPETGEVYAIYINPVHQGIGAGKALMAAGEHALHEAGFRMAMLWVLEGNIPARIFYERLGWRADSEPQPAEISGHPIMERCYRKQLVE